MENNSKLMGTDYSVNIEQLGLTPQSASDKDISAYYGNFSPYHSIQNIQVIINVWKMSL